MAPVQRQRTSPLRRFCPKSISSNTLNLFIIMLHLRFVLFIVQVISLFKGEEKFFSAIRQPTGKKQMSFSTAFFTTSLLVENRRMPTALPVLCFPTGAAVDAPMLITSYLWKLSSWTQGLFMARESYEAPKHNSGCWMSNKDRSMAAFLGGDEAIMPKRLRPSQGLTSSICVLRAVLRS